MNTSIKLMHTRKEEEIFLYALIEDQEKFNEEIIINTAEKTITNIKGFFEKLLEQSFLKDELYELSIENEEEIEQYVPGIVKLLKECITTYQQAVGI